MHSWQPMAEALLQRLSMTACNMTDLQTLVNWHGIKCPENNRHTGRCFPAPPPERPGDLARRLPAGDLLSTGSLSKFLNTNYISKEIET